MTDRRNENMRIRSLKTLIATDDDQRLQLTTPRSHSAPMPLTDAQAIPSEQKETRSSGMLVLAPSQRISNRGNEGSSDASLKLQNLSAGPANSPSEPPMSRERIGKIAEEVILARLDALAPEKIADLADMIVPGRVNHLFDEQAETHVSRAVANIAPAKVATVVRDLAPDMLASAVRDMTREEVSAQLPEAMSEALEESVASLIRQELAGDLGVSVTEKIRLLIRAEINRALGSN